MSSLCQVGLVAVNVIGDPTDVPYNPLDPGPVSSKMLSVAMSLLVDVY